VRSNDRQVGHTDLTPGVLLYKAHALNPLLVVGEPAPDGIDAAPVDFEDDF
jgi:hypothetical protein